MFKERRFAAGETVIQEGSGGGRLLRDRLRRGDGLRRRQRADGRCGPGDYFGEIALIDAGTRTATVTAASDLVCYGVTFWDFRPLVEENGVIGWKLLQSLIEVYPRRTTG